MSRIQNELLRWFLKHQRDLPWRNAADPYGIWVSEVMLQQTQVSTVIPYYERFLRAFPRVQVLARAPMQQVLKMWEGLGYYARARNLHRAARTVIKQHNGRIPEDRAALKALPGIGDYIAAALLSIAFKKPFAAVDGNVKRVLARFHQINEPVNDPSFAGVFKKAADRFLDRSDPGTFNQAMMELGALICTPKNPECESCPLKRECTAFKNASVHDYPRRIKKANPPTHAIAAGVICRDDDCVLITRRNPKGLLGGLWEFPGGKIQAAETPREACIREILEEVNLNVTVEKHIARIRHAYTHFKIVMDVFWCQYQSGTVHLRGPVDFRWVRLEEIDDYPFPGANRKFIPMLKKP